MVRYLNFKSLYICFFDAIKSHILHVNFFQIGSSKHSLKVHNNIFQKKIIFVMSSLQNSITIYQLTSE